MKVKSTRSTAKYIEMETSVSNDKLRIGKVNLHITVSLVDIHI